MWLNKAGTAGERKECVGEREGVREEEGERMRGGRGKRERWRYGEMARSGRERERGGEIHKNSLTRLCVYSANGP